MTATPKPTEFSLHQKSRILELKFEDGAHFELSYDRITSYNVCYTKLLRWQVFDAALGTHPHLVCYAVKANSSLAVLQVLARLGSGFDIVSAGELERVLRAGGEPAKIVFSGVGKQAPEMRRALEAGIRCSYNFV